MSKMGVLRVVGLLGAFGVSRAAELGRTIMVTYRDDCEVSREDVLYRSVLRSYQSGPFRDVTDLVRESVEENETYSSSMLRPSGGPRGSEEECGMQETWLKKIGLHILSMKGACERMGKEVLMGALQQDDCILTREFDKPRYASDRGTRKSFLSDSEPDAFEAGHQPSNQRQGAGKLNRESLDFEEVNRGVREVKPQDPYYYAQWHLDDSNPYSVMAQRLWESLVKDSKAHAQNISGVSPADEQTSVTVGVLDFGFSIEHQDLKNQVYTNPGEDCDSDTEYDGVDNDDNGFVDDCHGWNFANNSNDLKGFSHGTTVAGAAAAENDNNLGIASVCSECKYLPVTMSGSVSNELAGLNYLLSRGIRVINLSFGGPKSTTEFETLKKYSQTLFIASAGNEACDLDLLEDEGCYDNNDSAAGFPASLSDRLPNLISVGSHTKNGDRSSFSNFGKTRVQVFAPGTDILTTSEYQGRLGYAYKNGTSYSAPIVSGIAGQIKRLYPNLAPCQIRRILIQSCSLNPELNALAQCHGQVDANRALHLAYGANRIIKYYQCITNNEVSLNEPGFSSSLVGDAVREDGGIVAHMNKSPKIFTPPGGTTASAMSKNVSYHKHVHTNINILPEMQIKILNEILSDNDDVREFQANVTNVSNNGPASINLKPDPSPLSTLSRDISNGLNEGLSSLSSLSPIDGTELTKKLEVPKLPIHDIGIDKTFEIGNEKNRLVQNLATHNSATLQNILNDVPLFAQYGPEGLQAREALLKLLA